MTWFLFVGDMLVMLFMTLLVVWLSVRGAAPVLDYSAGIPLRDESAAQEGDTHG